MENEIKIKIRRLIEETRVMTLAVSDQDVPWSSPVYFVFHDHRFYFFSNENSRHIRQADGGKMVAASIFQDSDRMDRIFGFQMSGMVEPVSAMALYLIIVRKYVAKFSFLTQVFGSRVIEDNRFFLDKFKSRLYSFHPDTILLSDNSRVDGKRVELDTDSVSLG